MELNAAERQELQERRVRCQELETQVAELCVANEKLADQAQDEIFSKVLDLIEGEKREAYGPKEESLNCIAQVWSGILRRYVSPLQVCLCMAGLKLYREGFNHSKDNIVDACAYVRFCQDVHKEPKPCATTKR